ncbi:MFS transporter [Rhodopila sp.]|jgi:MFS family permease|uniref:MFS transporter n=1 Tax=Rhodopila sp. TaxID=2480087 RepID=UPI002C139623|nr:MFS transporter [Rhodopila sp.]HVZ10244.1 MFS transporter [Rhodopila sp.]
MAEVAVSPRMRRMQWIAIALATGAIALNYIDRSTLAIGNLPIRQEFGLNATAIGALQSFWSITYAICQVPIGFALDRLGPRYLIGFALVLWSAAQAAGGLAATYTQLMWARIALGATESPAFPGAVRITSDWFHVKDRGKPTGFYNSGGSIGPAIAPPLLTFLMLSFGWRVMFIAMGAAGLLAAVAWFKLYRDPAKTELEPRDEAYLRANREAEAPVELRNWGRLFRFRPMWGLMLAAFCGGYAVWMYQTWLPAYLEMQQHISIAKTGFLAMIPLCFSVLGALAGGWFTDRLARSDMDLIASRRLPSILGLLLSGLCTIVATQAGNATEAVICISAAMFFLSAGIAGKWTLITAVAPQSYCTSVASIQNFGGYLGGTASPLITGMVVDMTGSFVAALAIGAGMTILGAMILQLGVRSPIASEELDRTGTPRAASAAAGS